MAIITADGRDITKEEWRVIPGFTNYKITKDGDVLNRRRNTLLTESENSKGQFYYHLYSTDGKKTSRKFENLIDLAFPELAAPKPEKKGAKPTDVTYLSKEGWTDIPGFPLHQIHIDGRCIRTAKQRQKVRPKIHSITGEEYVLITNDEGLWAVSIEDLYSFAFPHIVPEMELAA